MICRWNNAICIAFSISLFLSMAAQGTAEFMPRQFEARRATTPPVIDGKLDEAVWQSAQKLDEFFAYQSGGKPAAAETTARILWDDDFLYLGFEMTDADIRPSSVTANKTGRDAPLYLGDVIELFVREDRNSPKYYEFEWSPKAGDVFDARFDEQKFGAPGIAWDTKITSAVTVEGTIDDATDKDTRWVVETSIPLDSFSPITKDSQWTFTVARYDYFNPASATEQLMTLTPGDPDLPRAGFASGFHTYELYDNIKFVPEPRPSLSWLAWFALVAVRPLRARLAKKL